MSLTEIKSNTVLFVFSFKKITVCLQNLEAKFKKFNHMVVVHFVTFCDLCNDRKPDDVAVVILLGDIACNYT